jgi:hypothetical protein
VEHTVDESQNHTNHENEKAEKKRLLRSPHTHTHGRTDGSFGSNTMLNFNCREYFPACCYIIEDHHFMF